MVSANPLEPRTESGSAIYTKSRNLDRERPSHTRKPLIAAAKCGPRLVCENIARLPKGNNHHQEVLDLIYNLWVEVSL